METVTSADGTEIAFERTGSGPPLVLLHGDLTGDFWDPIVPRFAGEYEVVVPDRRGRGESGDSEDYALEREVEDVHAVLDAVESGGDSILFGHSFGGLQAIEAARAESVAAVVAYEPAVIVGEYRERADLADRMEAAVDAGNPREAMRRHVAEVIHGGEIGDDELDRWLAEWPPWPEYARFAENALRMNRAIEEYRLPEELGVDAPTLLLTGTEGPSHLRESVRTVRDAVPDARLVEFDGVSHAGPVEAPDRVVPAVREFLDEEVTSDPAR